MGIPGENMGHEEEAGRRLRGAQLCMCLEWLVRNVDSDPKGCGVGCTERLRRHLQFSLYITYPGKLF